MIFPFDLSEGVIIVPARLSRAAYITVARLLLDTGANTSMIIWERARLLGYDPATVTERVQMTTGSAKEYAPRVVIDKIDALGRERENFPVLCHTPPSSVDIDGVLGLDFFRGCRLTLDFRIGLLTLD